ncbi:hypothetical protein COV24_03325 [candidate division WWE3 bacterium CG10_big_fil_rev_8_21_14_0_10_32_10]|uniref:Methyltransferase type 11 domain-containing protein n=1 Tax=candidate division WWE3 bacterium CG10_big_fil_rev_8_21_14_0_10_32_10 TaxID=1975090 RepID=A0A2H0R9X5_UNCKA|nr:MAG: hypothetical protein COV24_03325 [candidate division WWE3 bacterium CG10_big_fil_rev_8_21_14_0_10_32_10]
MQYLKEYTKLTSQEKRQNFYKRLFKKNYPRWDDSMVLLTKLFSKYAKNKSSILDAGCGNGNWIIDELPHKFNRKVGIDVNKQVVRKNTTLEKIIYGGIDKMPFEDKEFDNVVSLWVLEHVKNPDKVFAEISRVLKNEGYFGFVTPNKNYFLILLKQLFSQTLNNAVVEKFYGRKHIDIFPTFYMSNNLKEIGEIANKNGFKIVYLKENFDPSYTSFNSLSFLVSKLLYKVRISFFNAHIICLLQKV